MTDKRKWRLKMKAVLCPVCFGKGKIANLDKISNAGKVSCHGCFGRGWVEVHEERISFMPALNEHLKTMCDHLGWPDPDDPCPCGFYKR